METTLEDTVRTIQEAFAAVSYPGDDRIAYDQSGAHLECTQVASAFRGKHWRELDARFLMPRRQAIFFLTPEALAFYLPGYLLSGIQEYQEGGIDLVGQVLSKVDPMNTRFEASIALLTAEQRRAVAKFLRYIGEHHDDFPVYGPSGLLKAYWHQYR